jgi:Tol biopolymer transport system component
MGDKFNTAGYDFCPIMSPDGKFLFFTSKGDIFWVDIKVIEQFNPAAQGTVKK